MVTRYQNDLSSRGDSRRVIMEEAEDLESAWEEWEEQTAAPFSPAPGKTLAAFTLLLEGGANQTTNPKIGALKKNYTTALNKWRSAVGLYNALLSRLEDECVAWYAEATKVFPEGTPHGDMIRGQISTDYNPATPPASPEPPAAPQNVGLIPGAADSGELGVQCDVPEGATGLKIWREIIGNPPTLLATLTDVAALPHLLTFDPGENVAIFFTATNAGGESEPSVSVSATAP